METRLLNVIDDNYAWSDCPACGNMLKFGPGEYPRTACAACGGRFIAERVARIVRLEHMPDDDEYRAEQDADLDYA